MDRRLRNLTALLGLASVSIFVGTFLVFTVVNPDFDIACDYISKLGSKGEPYALYWNIVGFGMVGIILSTFGWFFGLCSNDRVLGTCLLVSGVGFAMAAIPTDFADNHSALSKAHYVSICFSLAGWCFGLARLVGAEFKEDFARSTANYTIVLATLPMLCIGGGVSAEPIAHRLVLTVLFGWILLNSVYLLRLNFAPEIAG